MNFIFPELDSHTFGEIKRPPRRDSEVRAALLGPSNGESYLTSQDSGFSLLNRIEMAAHAASKAVADAAKLERERHALERKLAWTPATVMRPIRGAQLTRLNLVLVLLLSAAGALGMIVSNVVLTGYALQSSDLFSNNRIGAALFATLPSFGAIAAKCFEQRLVSPDARWFYGVAVFALGMTSLVVWLVAAAITFAPDTGGSIALLTQGRNDGLVNIILLVTTIVCDVTLGASILSGVGHLLSTKQNSESLPNPSYGALLEEKLRLERAITECQRRHAEAQDYLSRAAAGRELTRQEALHDLGRARELWTQVQAAALAFATAIFLSNNEDMS